MSTDPNGWRGTGHEEHLTLRAEEDEAVQRAHARALEAKGKIEPKILNIAARSGGKLEGLEYSTKSLDSLRRKVATDVADGTSATDSLSEIRDLNRYTLSFPANSYTDGVRSSYTLLSEYGFEPYNSESTHKNSWNDPVYKGINTSWRDRETGQIMELQFHTPESYAAKSENHALYELSRSGSLSPREERAAKWLQAERYRDIEIPEGHESLASTKPSHKLERPSDRTLDQVRAMEAELKGQQGEHGARTTSSQEAGQAMDVDTSTEHLRAPPEEISTANESRSDEDQDFSSREQVPEDVETEQPEQMPRTESAEAEDEAIPTLSESDAEQQSSLEDSEKESSGDEADSASESQGNDVTTEQDDAEAAEPVAEDDGAETGDADDSSYEAHDEDEMDRISEAQGSESEPEDHGYGDTERDSAYPTPESLEREGI